MQVIEIRPLDTLFFKDGKPFAMGDDTWADGIFPPFPSVLYGALRTAYALSHGIAANPSAILAASQDFKILDIHLYAQQHGGSLYPLPRDWVSAAEKSLEIRLKEHKEGKQQFIPLGIYSSMDAAMGYTGIQGSHIGHDFQVFAPMTKDLVVESGETGLLPIRDFRKYLQGALEGPVWGKSLEQFLVEEPKVGIKRERQTHQAAEGRIYRVGMMRLQELSLRISLDGLDFSAQPNGLLKLGAEGKAASYQLLDEEVVEDMALPPPDGKHQIFKMVLTSPAIFLKGLPDLGQIPYLLNAGAELCGIIMGKALSMGGFDLRLQKPKPMYKAAPAGSVFLFRCPDPISLSEEELTTASISDLYQDEGFGRFRLAAVQPN